MQSGSSLCQRNSFFLQSGTQATQYILCKASCSVIKAMINYEDSLWKKNSPIFYIVNPNGNPIGPSTPQYRKQVIPRQILLSILAITHDSICLVVLKRFSRFKCGK